MTDALLTRGVEIKEEMFGAEHGQIKLDRATDFMRDFELLVARYCFGEIWGREEQLPRNLRSMITIAMLVAQGRSHEVKVHVQGALNNGVTVEQIREILLHAAIYCGVPAAVEGFRNASEVLDAVAAGNG
jgi:4-carboxymuconolactone decarboxylase